MKMSAFTQLEKQNLDKIENLNLIALRKYACPKINSQKDWYLRCMDCKSLSDCRAGKRAMELIEEQTKPDISKKKMRKASETRGDNLRQAAIKKIREAFGDCKTPEEFVRKHIELYPDTKPGSMRRKLASWVSLYPDLMKELQVIPKALKMIRSDARHMTDEEFYSKYSSKPDISEEADEISVDEFLSDGEEMGNDIPPAQEAPKEVVETPNHNTDQIRETLISEFSRKRRELKALSEKTVARIRELQENLALIDAHLKSLDDAALLFGFAPVEHKD